MQSTVSSQRQPWPPLTNWPGTLWNTSRWCHHYSSAQAEASKWALHENTRETEKLPWLRVDSLLDSHCLWEIYRWYLHRKWRAASLGKRALPFSSSVREEAAFHSLQVVPPPPSQQSHPTQTCCSPKPFVGSPGQAIKQPKETNLKKKQPLKNSPPNRATCTFKVSDRLILPTTWTWLTTQRPLQTTLSASAQQFNTSRVTTVGEQLGVRFTAFCLFYKNE